MKTLSLDLKIDKLVLDEESGKKNSKQLMADVIKNVCLGWSNSEKVRGMGEEDRRLYYKVCDELEEAVAGDKMEVQLDDDRMGFIKKCFREARFVPNELLRRVEILVGEVKDR